MAHFLQRRLWFEPGCNSEPRCLSSPPQRGQEKKEAHCAYYAFLGREEEICSIDGFRECEVWVSVCVCVRHREGKKREKRLSEGERKRECEGDKREREREGDIVLIAVCGGKKQLQMEASEEERVPFVCVVEGHGFLRSEPPLCL